MKGEAILRQDAGGVRTCARGLLCVALVGAVLSCERRTPAPPDIDRQPRLINSPPQGVRALPPHAIRGDGVGPYRLGIPLEQLGNQVPSGAQNARIDIPKVVHLNVLHAEEDAILVGAASPGGGASFVAVVRNDVARTVSGIHVGSTRQELVGALGAPANEPARARDPRIVVPEAMHELRAFFVEPSRYFSGTGGDRGASRDSQGESQPKGTSLASGTAEASNFDRISGLVVAAAEPPVKLPTGCVRPTIDNSGQTRGHYGACISGGPDILVVEGGDLWVRIPEGERMVRFPRVANLVWAAPLRHLGGSDDVVAISHEDDAQGRTWLLTAYRIEAVGRSTSLAARSRGEVGLRVAKVADATPVYQLTAANARWLGCELADLDLALEVAVRGESWEVGGLLVARRGEFVRDLYVLSSVQVPWRSGVSAGHTTGVETHPKVIGR